MNKNKITSLVLSTVMLFETLPVVSAQDIVLSDIDVNVTENSNVEYNEYIEQDFSQDILNNNNSTIDDVTEDNGDNNVDIEECENIDISSVGDDRIDDNILEEIESVPENNESSEKLISESISSDDTSGIENSLVVKSGVLEITLTDGEYVPNLKNNPDGYKTIVVKTIGNKKLVKEDYDNLRESKIPNIDLSQAVSDSIPAGAFHNATFLESFKFPQGLKSIGPDGGYDNGAFSRCKNLKGELVIPDTVTCIGGYAFAWCKSFTGGLIIPDSVETIEKYAFYDCIGLNGRLVIPNSVTSLGDAAFYDCIGLNGRLVIPNSISSIGYGVFEGCKNLTGTLTIPDSVITIDVCAFEDCSGFSRLEIPDSVTTIERYAFLGCSGLIGDLLIPNSVNNIGERVFEGCTNLDNIIIKVDESFADTNYRKDIFENIGEDKVVVDMSYNLDTTGTWLENLNNRQNGTPRIYSFNGFEDESKARGVNWRIPVPYKEENIVVYKDGELYDIPSKNIFGEYYFYDEGVYEITITTDLGAVSHISFECLPLIDKPSIEYNDNMVLIYEKEHGVYTSETTFEDFDDISNVKFEFSNTNWVIENGVLKSETIDGNKSTINEFKITAKQGDKLTISVGISSDSDYSFGCIYLNGIQVYKKNDCNTNFEVIELELTEGENTIEFQYYQGMYPAYATGNMLINSITLTKKVATGVNRIEYRINGSEWIIYDGQFRVPDKFINGVDDIKVEARVVVDGKVSKISEETLQISKAELSVGDIVITQGSEFNELDWVVATDIEGKDITDKVTIVSSDVNVNVPGKYKVVYRVTGSNGYLTEKTVVVEVVESLPDIDDSTQDDSKNDGNDANSGDKDKMPNTGGLKYLLYLLSVSSLAGGSWILIKKRKKA